MNFARSSKTVPSTAASNIYSIPRLIAPREPTLRYFSVSIFETAAAISLLQHPFRVSSRRSSTLTFVREYSSPRPTFPFLPVFSSFFLFFLFFFLTTVRLPSSYNRIYLCPLNLNPRSINADFSHSFFHIHRPLILHRDRLTHS